MRAIAAIVLLVIAVPGHAAIVLSQTGDLTEDSNTLSGGEYFEVFQIPVRADDVVRCTVQTEGFQPYLIAVTNDERQFERPGAELIFRALSGGEATVAVTSVEPAQTGVFRLEIDVLPLALPEGEGPETVLDRRGELGPGDRVLEGGEYAEAHRLTLDATVGMASVTANFDAYMVVAQPDGDPIDVDDVDGTDPALTWFGGGETIILVTSAKPGETGSYRLTVQAADVDWQPPPPTAPQPSAPPQPATPPQTPAPETPPAPADVPWSERIPPAPKLEGSTPLDLSDPEWVMPEPDAAGDASDLIRRGLHRMNYIEVQIWGEMDCYEVNAPWQREWPTGFGWDIDNCLQGAAGGPPVKCPVQWTGDIFTAYGFQPDGEGGHTEQVSVTGRVSADGSRILWVLVRSFEQGVYDDPDTDDRFARHQEWKSLGFVDLPLNNPHWKAYGTERLTTMADLMGRIDETLILRDGFTYGWANHANARDHVLEAGYMLRRPGPGDAWLVPDELHMLSYRSTEWLNANNPPTALLRFEYNEKLAP